MPNLAHECEREADALRLVDGTLDEVSANQFYDHAVDCVSCRSLLAELARAPSPNDVTLNSLGQLVGESWNPEDISGTAVGKYRLERELGAGGMGQVFLARDDELDRDVAIKVVQSDSPETRERVLREARAMAQLRHPNVAAVYETGESDGVAFIAMEYVVGENLREWMALFRAKTPWESRLSMAVQAGRGLRAAHRAGVIHRDFKPENIMVGHDGRVQVLDFGLAAQSGAAGALAENAGTPSYMAPEQFSGTKANEATDQFAFATVVFELLFGTRPYPSKAFAPPGAEGPVIAWPKAMPRLPKELASALTRGLSTRPEERFPSMDEALSALEHVQTPKPRRWWRAAPVVACAAAAAVFWPSTPKKTSQSHSHDWTSEDLPPTFATPIEGDLLGSVTVHRLSNGLTVYINTKRDKPTISTSLVFRAGFQTDSSVPLGVADLAARIAQHGDPELESESPDEEAVHLAKLDALYRQRAEAPEAERATFDAKLAEAHRSARKLAVPRDRAQLYQALGVQEEEPDVTAHGTAIRAVVPSNRFATWANLESARWKAPVRRLVELEFLRTKSSLEPPFGSSAAIESFEARILGEAPRQVRRASIAENIPYEDVERYAQRWFVPNNAALILSGDIDAATALPILERSLGPWTPRRTPERSPAPSQARGNKEPVSVPSDSYLVGGLALGFETVPSSHDDHRVVALIGNLLYDELESHVRGVGYDFGGHRDGGFLALLVAPEEGQSRADIRQRIDTILSEIAEGKVHAFERNRDLQRARQIRAEETARNRVITLEWSFLHVPDWASTVTSYLRPPIRMEEVQRVIKTYFHSPYVVHFDAKNTTEKEGSGSESPKEGARADNFTFSDALQSAKARDVASTEAVALPPRFAIANVDYSTRDSALGPLAAIPNRTNGLFDLRFNFAFGARKMPFLCAALEANLSEARRQQKGGIDYRLACSPDDLSVGLHGPDDQLPRAWPEFQQAIERAPALAAWKRSIESTPFVPGLLREEYVLYWYALYGRTDFADGFPSEEVRRKATLAEAQSQLFSTLRSPLLITYFGPRTADEVTAVLDRDWRVPDDAPPVEPEEKLSWREYQEHRVFLMNSEDASETRLFLPLPQRALAGSEPHQRALAEVLAEHLRSRLSQRLETDIPEPLAVAIEPNWDDAKPHLEVTLDVPAARLPSALASVWSELRDERHEEHQLRAAGLAVEKRYRHDWIPPRELASEIVSWNAQGSLLDPRPARFAAVASLPPSEAIEALDELVQQPRILAVTTADAAALAEELAPFGTVEVLQP